MCIFQARFYADAVPVNRALQGLLHRCCPAPWTLLPIQDTLHISLTRPILLRIQEKELFIGQVSQCLRDSRVHPYVAGLHSFAIGFAQFTCFPSDTSSRVFLALETSSGWHEMAALTDALSKRLYALFQVPSYYNRPRFHVSYAYCEPANGEARSELIARGQCLARQLNDSLAKTLRIHGPLFAHALEVQVGQHIRRLMIPSTALT